MEIIEALKDMQDIIKEGGKAPVLFVGSGLSRRYYGTPNWEGLLDEIATRVGVDKEQRGKWGGYEKQATELEYHCFANKIPLYNKGEDRRFPLRKIIEEIINTNRTILSGKETEVKALAGIIPTAIITTNYDEFLENTFGNKYSVCVGQDIIWGRTDNNSKTIYKIHGSVSDPASIVITQEDYDTFMSKSKYLYAKLMTLFWENPIVFMGYGINDNNVKNVLDTILDVMTEEQKTEFEKRIWVLSLAEEGKESFEETEISTGKNKTKIKKFSLDNSYVKFYEALGIATQSLQENDLKFTIAENAIELLIKPLYQNQDKFKVVVRELLQNAMDACKKAKKTIKVTIDVIIKDDNVKLRVADSGIGMDINDITNFFLAIGKSNKNEDDNSLTGKFGIGILSIFLIGKEAKVYSQKEASRPIGIRIFQGENEKKVEKIDAGNTFNNSGTIVEVNIDDENIAKIIKEANTIDKVITSLGLNDYCVLGDTDITVGFGKTEDRKSLEKLDLNDESMFKKNDDLYIEKIYADKKTKKHLKGTALINDMITSVTFGTTGSMLKKSDIPFFAVKTGKGYCTDNVKPDLSRKNVEIVGDLKEDVVSYVYEEEVDRLICAVKGEMKKISITALNLCNNVISYSNIFRNQIVIYYKDAVIFPSTYIWFIKIYNSPEAFAKLVEKKLCAYNRDFLRKTELGNLIENGGVVAIGVDYLDKYIYEATGSYNGFRMLVIETLFEKLGIGAEVPYDNATNMWSNIIKNKEMLRGQYVKQAINGIICFDKEYENMLQGVEGLNEVLITKECSLGIDNKFIEVLKSKLNSENEDVRRHLIVK